MADNNEIISLLNEIRDNQREALALQKEQVAIAAEQIERSRTQVTESIELQKQAVDRFRTVFRIAVPGIAFCIAMILYLIIRYF